MKILIHKIALSFFAAFLANTALASKVSSDEVARAATAFVSADSIGSLVLKGCSVANISQRGNLWIVALSPSGHIVMSGSDFADPIVAFSKNDFAEPDPESPAFAVLEGAGSSVAALETQGDGSRHERWTKLLGGGMAKKGLLRAEPVDVQDGAVTVLPFMREKFNQDQPYNDYAPVHAPAPDTTSYRGRCPCGCVATAAAQVFHHFKWPARIDNTISHAQNVFTVDSGNTYINFPIRFDGHEPIDWSAISNGYTTAFISPNDDMRGTWPESMRYPISRLMLWCDVLAEMEFEPGDSGANYDTVVGNVSDWYTTGRWVDVANYAALVKKDILAGVPCQVSIGAYKNNVRYKGHEVVAHGWAEDGSTKYVYINFGWGGYNDGYYNIANDFQDYSEKEVYIEHYPRAKPQVDPLPMVSGTGLTLDWHFPDFYTNNLSGFTVAVSKSATTTSPFLDDFSATEGSSSSSDIYVDVDGELYSDYAADGSYTYPKTFTLTSASELTFKVSSYAALTSTLEVQARYNGGAWQRVSAPDLDEGFGAENWNVQRVYLGDHGGETVQFRIVRGWGGYYYVDGNEDRVDYGYVLIDDFKVTNVLAPLSPEIKNVGKTARSCAFTGLASGATCSFSVMPNMSGALAPAEASAPVTTSIAGERRTPKSGIETCQVGTVTFSESDVSGSWSWFGSQADGTCVYGDDSCTVVANLQGPLTANSTLTFTWECYDEYESGEIACDVLYVSELGETTLLERRLNGSSMSNECEVPLSAFQGKKGAVKIHLYLVDPYAGWWSRGLLIQDPKMQNVNIPSVPAVAWDTETLVARGMPEILSVSDVSESAMSEGFYGECGTNTTTFAVQCSSSVTNLCALPSHLSLVRDEDVSVSNELNGAFRVYVTPSGVDASNFRSRMILTLVGTDSNGTKCYKDLSLRFSPAEPTEVHVAATTSSGAEFSVEIPYSWIEDCGLVEPNSDATAYEAALASTADYDSDGIPNWAEYVCGTSPTNSADKLTVFIDMMDGEPVVTYTPNDGIASGFKAVIKGTTDLAAALSTWEVVTDTRTSTCRFFRVEIVPED